MFELYHCLWLFSVCSSQKADCGTSQPLHELLLNTSLLFVYINVMNSVPLADNNIQIQGQVGIREINGIFTVLIHIEKKKEKLEPKRTQTTKSQNGGLKLTRCVQHNASWSGGLSLDNNTLLAHWIEDSLAAVHDHMWCTYLSNFGK